MSTYNSPTDLAPLTKARSVDINNFDAAVAAAFAVLPTEADIYANRVNYGIDSGVANSYVVTLPTPPTVMFDGLTIMFSPKTQNTGASTINVGLGTFSIRLRDSTVLRTGDIVPGVPLVARYSVATGFFHIDGNPTIAATGVIATPVSDATALLSNAGDPTKLLRFDLSPLSPGASRVVTLQDRDMVLGKTFLDRSPRAANTALIKADQANLIDYTAGGFTQTFATSTTLGRGWWAYLQNSGAGDVELQSPAAVSTTSTTSNSIAAGTTWTLPTGLSIGTGDTIVLRRTADPFNQRVTGFVTSYTSGTGVAVVSVIARVGSGTFTDWSVSVCPVASAIDGLPSYVMYPGELRLFYVPETGVGIRSIVLRTFYRKATTSYAFICPPGYRIMGWDGVGGAGGAGGGAKVSAATAGAGGSPGGAPARIRRRIVVSIAAGLRAGYSYAQSIGAAGTSALGQSLLDTAGLAGTAGGSTTFGTLATAPGGIGGLGGATGANSANGVITGSGSYGSGVGLFSSGGSYVAGGAPVFGVSVSGNTNSFPYEEGGACGNGGAPTHSVWGGGAAITNATSTVIPTSASSSSIFGVPGGGWGGAVTTANQATPGYPAGATGSWTFNAGASGGTSGTTPTVGTSGVAPATDFDMGSPGGGGGSCNSQTGNGARGGDGAGPGAPGGGGGACNSNGANNASGGGGTSQPGQSITWGEL